MDKELFKNIFLRLIGPEVVSEDLDTLTTESERITTTALALYNDCVITMTQVEAHEEENAATLKRWADDVERDRILSTNIMDVDMSVRVFNRLVKPHNIQCVGDLTQMCPNDILRIKGLGRKGLIEIEELLDSFGLKLKPNPKY